jgi:hypothetical protein
MGPTGTLATTGMEYSWSVFWTMVFEADGVVLMVLVASRVAEEEVT